MTFYIDILTECAWKASIIPLGNDPTFFALKAFGGHDMTVPLLLAVTGATLGQSFNWLTGRFLSLRKTDLKVTDYWYNRVATLFNRYGLFLLLLSWVPMCNLFVVLAGFVGTKPKIVLPLVIVGQIYNYGQFLL